MVSGVAFVLINHDNKCEPRDYELVMIYQKFLEDGNIAKAWAIAVKEGFAYKRNYNTNTIHTADKEFINDNRSNSENVTNLKRKMVSDSENDSISRDEKSPVHKKSKRSKLALKDTVASEDNSALLVEKLIYKSDKKKEVDLSIHQISAIPRKMKKVSSVSTTSSIYHFEKPSISKLEEICVKLNIEYHNSAAKLWDTIIFDQLDTVTSSANIKTHPFKTENFFQILSIYFTGKSEQHRKIKTTIIDSFPEKAVSYGLMSKKDFNDRFMYALTDGHFIFIANFLKCRILIFDGKKKAKKYGNWESTSNACLTLVVAFKDGDYSIVLNL